MNICVFDTETTSLEKPFVYNIGYIILDEDFKPLVKRDFIVEQVWHNYPLFCSAYYADKREIYISRMKGKTVEMRKFGFILRTMFTDFEKYKIENAYAYNAPFDEKVFNFNCDWFRTNNPFESVKIFDVRGFVHNFISNTADFQNFCERNSFFTESGHYSTTAETLFRYLDNNIDFNEEHTALADSEIESKILQKCIERGADLCCPYVAQRSIVRNITRHLSIEKDGIEIFNENYEKITIKKTPNDTLIKLK